MGYFAKLSLVLPLAVAVGCEAKERTGTMPPNASATGGSSQRGDSGVATSRTSTDTSARRTTAVSTDSMTGDLVLTLMVDTTNSARPSIRGATNLPDGAELLVEIRSLDQESDRYQDKPVVKDGAFFAGPFGDAGGMPEGSYVAEANLSAPVQPNEVKAIIGQSGERLRGPLVRRKAVWGAIAEVSARFSIGGQEGVAAGRARAARTSREARLVYSELLSLLARGREMRRWRGSDDMAVLRKCGTEMRKNIALQERLRARVDSLPVRYMALNEAATYLGGCVTCDPGAEREWCSLAAQRLREAREEVR
jgi:hypothetical protein